MTDVECVNYATNSEEIVVYPNPARDIVHVEFVQETALATVELQTIEGKILASKRVTAGESCSFDVDSYESGVYLIRIVDGSKVTTKQVIVNR